MCGYGNNCRFNHPANTGQVKFMINFNFIYISCLIGVGVFPYVVDSNVVIIIQQLVFVHLKLHQA